LELLFNKSDKALNKIQVNTEGKQVDSGKNHEESNIKSIKELDLNSSKNNST